MSAADRSVYFSKISSAAGGSVVGAGRYQPGRRVCSRDSMVDVYRGVVCREIIRNKPLRDFTKSEKPRGAEIAGGVPERISQLGRVRQITYHWHSRECGIPAINEFLGQLKEKRANQTAIPDPNIYHFHPHLSQRVLDSRNPPFYLLPMFSFFLWRGKKRAVVI